MNDADNTTTTCANCGKGEESSGDLKACTACKLVKYCNRECQIAHRPQHKKACKKRATELHDEALFKEPPPPEECPICFLPMPLDGGQATFSSCCGKLICSGCIAAMIEEAHGRDGPMWLCAFCRKPRPTSEEDEVNRLKKLVDAGNADACYHLAGYYEDGHHLLDMPQDYETANKLHLRAGELGCSMAYFNLGNSYHAGEGVTVDKKKAKHYWELAAMNGNVAARHNLGCGEMMAGNHERAYKHFILAARSGDEESLNNVKNGFMEGIITKDEYANTLRAYQKIQDEMKSDMRDKAVALGV